METWDVLSQLDKDLSDSDDDNQDITYILAEALDITEQQVNKPHFHVATHWWGIEIIMNEQLTAGLVSGNISQGDISSLLNIAFTGISLLEGPVAGLISFAFASAFELKKLEINLADKNHNGVQWPCTWVQFPAILASIPAGPSAIIAAIMLFVHPFPINLKW